jgi:hypothetical protein
MGKVGAQITMSLDGYVAGPNDGPGRGLGERGERLHYWVFELEQVGVVQSPWVTHLRYRVLPA